MRTFLKLMTAGAPVLALIVILSATTAEAKHRHVARHSPMAVTVCVSDNNSRTTCANAVLSRQASLPRRVDPNGNPAIVRHPAGCPWRAFCGCGVSVELYGHPVRELYLARNYGYYFNAASFGPGMVGYRSHHVLVIRGGTITNALVYDPNSGGHQTRVHHRDLSTYRFVDPNSAKRRLALH